MTCHRFFQKSDWAKKERGKETEIQMFKKLSEKPVAEVQNEQVKQWKEEDLLHKCVTARDGQPKFVFYEGPPTANGKPGIHHVMARTAKGFHLPLQDHEGIPGQQKGRMGHPWTACRNRSGKTAEYERQTGYREIRHQGIQRKVQRVRFHIHRHVERDDRENGLPGGFGRPIYHTG